MKNKLPIVQKISKEYCSDDCVQLMFSFEKAFCIIRCKSNEKHKKNKEDELLYYYNGLEPQDKCKLKYTNKYLSDERRKQFPYSDLPLHIEGKFKKHFVVNQILDYNVLYTIMYGSNSGTFEIYCKAFKTNDGAIVLQDVNLTPLFNMSGEELEQLVSYNTKEPKIKLKANCDDSMKSVEQQKVLSKTL